MNVTKKKQTHRYTGQTYGYQWGGGRDNMERGVRDTNYQV